MHRDPKVLDWRTPCHLAGGCGGFQRSGPTGGAAKGMPRKSRAFPSALIFPCTLPWSVLITNGLLARPGKAKASAVIPTAAYFKIGVLNIGTQFNRWRRFVLRHTSAATLKAR